ncbi:MAG: endonuclease/exonuclease/phosphatase family protein [Candidatus Binatia bacterium]
MRSAILPLAIVATALGALVGGCRAHGIEQVGEVALLESVKPQLPREFRIASWNIQKGLRAGMPADLERLVRTSDPQILLLQEAHEQLELTPLATNLFATSWRYPWFAQSRVGVHTAAIVRAMNPRSLETRFRELGFTSPKVSLITEYRLPDDQRLMTVNVHCMNFERFGTTRFRAQLGRLREEMAGHSGPIVMAGDFNTWRAERLGLLQAMTKDLDLVEVDQFPSGRTTATKRSRWVDWLLGIDPELALDRVYYRGLDVVEADVLDYDSSDHRPIVVGFSLPSDS